MNCIRFKARFMGKVWGVDSIQINPASGEIEKVYLSEDGFKGWDTYAKPGEEDFELLVYGIHENARLESDVNSNLTEGHNYSETPARSNRATDGDRKQTERDK